MAGIGTTAAEAASDGRGHVRVLAAFALSIAVHALFLASARDWRVAGLASGRSIVVTLREGTGGDAAAGRAAGAAAGSATTLAASAVAAVPAPLRDVPAPLPDAVTRPNAAPRARVAPRPPTTIARAPTHRPSDAPPARRAETAAPVAARVPAPADAETRASATSTALDGSAPPAGVPSAGAGALGAGEGRGGGVGDGDGRGHGTGLGAGGDGLRALCASCPAPEYPARARRQGWQGTVDVALAIDGDGRVTEARVRRSSGYPPLDDVALDVARRSRFTVPPTGEGVRGELRYRFVLDATAARR